MTLKWSVVLLDRAINGVNPTEIDITARHHYDSAQFQFSGQENPLPSTTDILFQNTESYNIREGQEFWAGWRDTATRVWSNTGPDGLYDPVRGGYISVQVGGENGPYHTLALTLDDYSLDLDTTDILVWPGTVDDYLEAYPDGYSARDWLVGVADAGLPFDGLIPARLGGPDGRGGYDLNGVDDAFADIIFERGVKPGTPVEDVGLDGGFWGFVDLRSAITDIISAITFIDGTLDPVAFVRPIIDPFNATRIRPQFCLVDRNNTTAPPVATFAIDPGPDEWPILQPFSHTRNIHDARQRAVVKGQGTDPTSGGLVYAATYNAARPVQPTVYQTDPGRSGKPWFDGRINTVPMAQGLADQLEARAWGPDGTIRLRTTRPTLPGEIVALRIPQEGQLNTKYRVASVSTVRGVIRYYDLTIGAPKPDLGTMLQRAAQKASALQQLAALGLPTPFGQSGLPSAPRRVPVVSTPTHDLENVISPQYQDAVGFTMQATDRVRPGSPPGPAKLLFTAKPPPTPQVPAPAPGTSISAADGRPHPQTFFFQFAAAGSSGGVVHWDCDISAVRCKGTGTVTLNRNGIAVAGPFSTAGLHTITPAVHYSVAGGDDLSVTAAGVTAPPTYYVTVSE